MMVFMFVRVCFIHNNLFFFVAALSLSVSLYKSLRCRPLSYNSSIIAAKGVYIKFAAICAGLDLKRVLLARSKGSSDIIATFAETKAHIDCDLRDLGSRAQKYRPKNGAEYATDDRLVK